MLDSPKKLPVIGVAVSVTSYEATVAQVDAWVDARRRGPDRSPARYVCVTSVHGVMTAHKDPFFRRILNHADLVTPDGMPIVWALRSLGQRTQQRVYGPTLMLELCRSATARGARIFLYGSREEVLPALESRLGAIFPGIKIAGSYSPPFRPLTPTEDEQVIDRIRETDPDLIFVGISTPKQERWMWEHRNAFPGVVMVGVGAAFDFHAGRVRQAPPWMQRNGLEWLFRLLSEPRRLWRRYLLETPQFIPRWILQRLRLVNYDLPGLPPEPSE
jgi:N-acetylglucosaminyldiphosphoundecaprenol N-acetyl-beta-D-mannosaminyltransferase